MLNYTLNVFLLIPISKAIRVFCKGVNYLQHRLHCNYLIGQNVIY